jgi:hypothetical protein
VTTKNWDRRAKEEIAMSGSPAVGWQYAGEPDFQP